jgi:hypothetical protein
MVYTEGHGTTINLNVTGKVLEDSLRSQHRESAATVTWIQWVNRKVRSSLRAVYP